MAQADKKEFLIWILVAAALAALLYIQRNPGYSWERDLNQRIAVDFNKTQEDVKEYIQKYIPDVSDGQIAGWTASGKLESAQIGGRTMYFHSAGPNLFRIVPELAAIKAAKDGVSESLTGHEAIDAQTIPAIREEVGAKLESQEENTPGTFIALPKRMRVRFTLTVPANTLRPRKTLRCWLPFPRQDVGRQSDVKLIEAGVNDIPYPQDKIIFSSPDCPHSSLYMEAKVRREQPTTFYEVFEYTSAGEWHPIDSASVKAYDTASKDYQTYTSERTEHIIFSDRIRTVADSLTEGISNPYLQARKIYTWVNDSFPWASAREYSTIPDIPEYVLSSGHGDCGQVTLLFMTLCRAKGIPARWQSGLMMHPGAENLHDWCEVYFEGVGWVPVDQSFGITGHGGYFFFGGIDPYRMVVNNDFGGQMDPPKKFPRSDTVDFQRGEVEWEGGNLYYSHWDYSFTIEYLD